jgi:HK97 family phage portal protein
VKSLVGEVMAAAGRTVATRTSDTPPVPYTQRAGLTRWLLGGHEATTERALAAMGSVGTLYAIVDLHASSTSAVDWHLWRTAASGKPEDRVEVMSHAALDTWRRPNRFYSQARLVESAQQHVELVGEGWIVCETSSALSGVPLGLWPVRPDRIIPVPSAEHYLAGYVYTAPDGDKIPLSVDQVMSIQVPNPMDPYRGMGAVQSILADADSIAAAVAWNRNFFVNGAEPGGIIAFDAKLSDAEWDTFVKRWTETHRGVGNAHRVGVIEQGKWMDRTVTHRDMDFTQLRTVSRNAIREAFRVHGHMLGDADDVNLANATAAEITFARRQLVPRLDRWKEMLNTQYLPKFGSTAAGLEFDYDNPVAEDEQSDAATFYDRGRGAQMLVLAGFNGEDVAAAAGLPPMRWDAQQVTRSTTTIAGESAGGGRGPASESDGGSGWADRPANVLRMAAPAQQPPPGQAQDLPDVSHMAEALAAAMAALMVVWRRITGGWRRSLVDQVRQAAQNGGLASLSLSVDTGPASAALLDAMANLAPTAAHQLVAEAAAQGVEIPAAMLHEATLQPVADEVADLLGQELTITARRAVLLANHPGATADEIGGAVQSALDGLSDAGAETQLGGALHGTMNTARIATLSGGPVGSLYAQEMNDHRTCDPCRHVNGRFLGTTDDLAQVLRSYPAGAFGGYVGCLGGPRCRGTVTGVWREGGGG